MLAAPALAIVGEVGGASLIGGEGDEPVLVRPVAARHAEVTAAQASDDLEVFPDVVVEHDPLRPRALDGGGLGLVGLGMRYDPADVVARVLDQRLCRAIFEVEQDQAGGVGPARVYEVHLLAVLGEAYGGARERVLLAPPEEPAPIRVFVVLAQEQVGAAVRR